jgi:hypothetical protein
VFRTARPCSRSQVRAGCEAGGGRLCPRADSRERSPRSTRESRPRVAARHQRRFRVHASELVQSGAWAAAPQRGRPGSRENWALARAGLLVVKVATMCQGNSRLGHPVEHPGHRDDTTSRGANVDPPLSAPHERRPRRRTPRRRDAGLGARAATRRALGTGLARPCAGHRSSRRRSGGLSFRTS